MQNLLGSAFRQSTKFYPTEFSTGSVDEVLEKVMERSQHFVRLLQLRVRPGR